MLACIIALTFDRSIIEHNDNFLGHNHFHTKKNHELLFKLLKIELLVKLLTSKCYLILSLPKNETEILVVPVYLYLSV